MEENAKFTHTVIIDFFNNMHTNHPLKIYFLDSGENLAYFFLFYAWEGRKKHFR